MSDEQAQKKKEVEDKQKQTADLIKSVIQKNKKPNTASAPPAAAAKPPAAAKKPAPAPVSQPIKKPAQPAVPVKAAKAAKAPVSKSPIETPASDSFKGFPFLVQTAEKEPSKNSSSIAVIDENDFSISADLQADTEKDDQ